MRRSASGVAEAFPGTGRSAHAKGVTAYLLGYPEAARAELEAALTQAGAAAPRSRARYYLGLADWKLSRLHLEGFLEYLEGPDRQSLTAAEATRALASIYSAQGEHERAAELAGRAETILTAIDGRWAEEAMEALVPLLVCCGIVLVLVILTAFIGRGR